MRRGRPPLRIVRQSATGARIANRRIAVRCRQRLRDVGARAEAGVNHAPRFQCIECGLVGSGPPRLDLHRLVPADAEPMQILEDAVDEFLPAAGLVKVLDPEEELAPGLPGPLMPDDRTKGMAKMQPTRRRRRETRHNHERCDRKDS